MEKVFSIYAAPETEVYEIKSESVLCDSSTVDDWTQGDDYVW